MSGPAPHDPTPVPWLMRDAHAVYRDAIGRSLASVGCDDMPRNGAFVLAGLDQGTRTPTFSPQADVVASLGLSKQAASQLIDTLVLRDYVERRIDPGDRRRMEVRLSQRGATGARAIQTAIDQVDTELARRLTAEELRGLRSGLAAFREIAGQLAD